MLKIYTIIGLNGKLLANAKHELLSNICKNSQVLHNCGKIQMDCGRLAASLECAINLKN
ncbi:hypothetical protein [Legionella jordanis]|uniref:hypothetical protein n=1 Tax=Legionella jordanis TaxID=456 RepID=UPI000B05F80F|nr:hypothetical protein [Legionella jordanis]